MVIIIGDCAADNYNHHHNIYTTNGGAEGGDNFYAADASGATLNDILWFVVPNNAAFSVISSSKYRRTIGTLIVIALATRIMWKFVRHLGEDTFDAPTLSASQLQSSSAVASSSSPSSSSSSFSSLSESGSFKKKKRQQIAVISDATDNARAVQVTPDSPKIFSKSLRKFKNFYLTPPRANSSNHIDTASRPFGALLRSYSVQNDERDTIQKKTFTKWVNKHLIKVTKGVVDLFTDLRDGNNLISLLEVLSGEQFSREKGKMRVHHMQNVQTCLKFLVESRRIKLINIRADDIVDGNPKLTLGLIWTIILHFQLSDIIILDDSMSFKEALLRWAQKTTEGYPDVNVKDFTRSWSDGLAFNAIIHRNRPDLLDYRSCKSRTARQNLEHVFNVCERDLAVTRLLDAEDVDCPNPDEKSLITYISSLYELFPEPPENNPLLDNERIKQIERYKKLAENLVSWMRKSTKWLNERKFPLSLKEMKRVQEDTHRFRAEEIPPHFSDKQILVNSYKEILKMALALPIRIEDEYKPESLESQWKTMLQAYQERDRAIHEHMTKLEDLDYVADKLRKNIKECDRKLDEIQARVFEEQKRVLKCNPLEPNPRVEEIQRDLKFEEERIETMLRDAKYLVECEYPTGNELYQAVLNLQEKHHSISLDFKTKVLDVLEARRAQALKRPLTEAELIASNDMFRFLHECIQWCLEQQQKMAGLDYGHDRNTVQKFLEEHKTKVHEINQFQSRVDRCDMNKSEFETEVLEVYLRMLQRLHKSYSELKNMANDRLMNLDSLLDLLKEIEREVKWTEDVIAPEIVRDWSAPELSISQVEDEHRKLHYEIKSHDSHLEAIVNKAEKMIRNNHPAVECITKSVNFLNFKKKLLFEMFNTLEEHKQNAHNYHQFFADMAKCREWMDKAQHQLNTTFSAQTVTFEEGEALQKEMLKLKELINEQRRIVNDLDTKSKAVCPLKMRASSQAKNVKVSSMIKISSDYLKLTKGEQLTLKDNFDVFSWKTQTITGETIAAPNLCFLIPPPDKEAAHKFAELRKQYEDLIGLWSQKNHELRQNMLLATIRNLKGWDYPTYCSKDPAQRDAILNALGNDIDRVVAESAPGDHKSQRLLDEFDDLKKKFAEYEARRRAELEAKELEKLLKAFVDSIAELLNKLRDHEKIITRRLQEPIQRRLEDVTNAIREHEMFESETKRFEPAVKRAMSEYAQLPKSPITQSTYDALVDCWKKIQVNSEKYSERLSALKVVLKDIEDASKLVVDYETKLATAPQMSASVDEARSMFEQFKSLHNDIQSRTANFDKLLSNVSKIRRLVERSRLQTTSSTDIDQLENDMKGLHKRFNACSGQSLERVKSLENCIELLRNYRNKLERESSWMKQADKRCDDSLKRRNLGDAKQLYEEISSHKASIEECNSIGKRFMNEAKTYDMKLKNYRESVEQYHRSMDLTRTKLVSGIEVVTSELVKLNAEYQALLDKILDILNQLQDDEEKLKEFSETCKSLTQEIDQMTAAAHDIGHPYTGSQSSARSSMYDVSAPLDPILESVDSLSYHEYEEGESVPSDQLTDSELYSTNSVVSTVKVEHNIHSDVLSDSTEITIKRTEETEVKNSEIIIRRCSLIPSRESVVTETYEEFYPSEYSVPQNLVGSVSSSDIQQPTESTFNIPTSPVCSKLPPQVSVATGSVVSEYSALQSTKDLPASPVTLQQASLGNVSDYENFATEHVSSPQVGPLTVSSSQSRIPMLLPSIPTRVSTQIVPEITAEISDHSSEVVNINLQQGSYENVTRQQKMSIEQSVRDKLLDFKVNIAGASYLLSERIDPETLLIKLPTVSPAPMTFEQLKESGLLTPKTLSIIDTVSGQTIPLDNLHPQSVSVSQSTVGDSELDTALEVVRDPEKIPGTSEPCEPSTGSQIPESGQLEFGQLNQTNTPIESLPTVLTFKREEVKFERVSNVGTVENEISKRLFEWLAQKERLVSDLGPICSEPKMLASQLHQIQNMKEDFSTQTANLNKMDMLADSLLERLDSSNPNVRPIKSRRDDIHSKWNSLKSALDERERNLLNVKDAAADFQAKYEKLMAALQKVGDDFERIVSSGADNEEQLLKLSSLEDNLDGLRPAIADCELSCEKLCDLLTDAASKNEVRNKVSSLRKLYEDLVKKINDKKAELQNHIKEDKDFYYECDAIQDWLRDMQIRLNKDARVSAILEKVTKQVADFEPVYQNVLQKEHEIYMLVSKASQLQRRLTRPADISQLKSKVDSVKKQWDQVKDDATNHHTKLQKCLDIATKYNNALNNFLPWLKQMENKLKQTGEMMLQKPHLEKLLREFQMHKSEISRHVSEFENVCNLGEQLINSADVDTEVIRDQLNEVKRRWNDLQNDLNSALEEFEKLLGKLGEYSDKARDLNHGLNRLSDKLGNLDSKDPKQLDKLKALVDDSKALGDQLENLKKAGFKLIDEAGPKFDGSPIRDELAGFDDKMNDLAKRLADAHGGLEKAAKYLNKFNQDLSEIERKLRSLEESLDQMTPIGRTIPVVESQIEEMEDFNQKLRDVKADLNDAERQAEEIINKGYSTDPSAIRSAVSNLNRKYERIDERAKGRMDALKDALDKLKNFNRQVKENLGDIRDVLGELEALKPISREVDAIKQQQREFQNFQRTRVDPLAEKVALVTKLGNDLIQSAPNGVNTNELERELEKHSDQWNDLKDKISDRERKLDLALLQAGKFKDALNSVEKWLAETEEIVANQKPPSSDFKALRAQIQEQKFLVKMLNERESSIDSLEELGKEFMANLDRPEREQIEKQLGNIRKRFNNLVDVCDKRMKVLESSFSAAKEFADRIAPLQEWLEGAIRRLNQLQSFSIEEDKLQKRIGEHKLFHSEVTDKQRDFKDLSKCAQKLIDLIQNDDEEKLVKAKLSDITDKYGKLCKDSDDLGKLLQDTFDEMAKFLSQMNKITGWLADTDLKLNQYKVLSIQWDALKQQHNELDVICRDINDKQGDITDFIAHGQSLLKRFSSNDSYFIRQKLDNIQSKYNDLKQRAVDKLDYCKAALILAEKFYKSHDILTKWLDVSEKELEKMDSLPISAQNDIVVRIESEVQPKRRVLDSVNNLGTEFARISPGSGQSTIQGMVSKCNRRFQAIVDLLQRKSEKLRALMEQNKTIGNELDELLEWFRDAERKLMDAEPIVPNYDVLMKLLRETKSMNDDINNKKGSVRDVISNVKRLMRDNVNDEINAMNNKADELKELANHVSQLCQNRLNVIEEALPLVEHFFTAHNEIVQFLDEAEAEAQMLAEPSVYPDAIRKQQEATRRLIQSLNAQKPLFERLNKSGTDLMKLLQKHDARDIQKIMDNDNDRYNKLRNMLREHQNVLEAALQNTAQFADKLDGMLHALAGIHDQLKNADPVSAFVEKIKEQIADNRAIMEDLNQKEPAYNAVRAQAKEVIAKAGRSDEHAIRDIRNKLEKLNTLWTDCHKMANDRHGNLEEALRLAKQFWDELSNVMRSIQELEDTLQSQEPAGVEPAKIEEQQKILREIKKDMDRTVPELEHCKKTGKKLMKVCGEPDKPEVRKNLEELDNAWDNVTSLYAKREKSLIDAMGKAMDFHELMKKLVDFLDEAEDRFNRMGPIASDIDAVKRQIADLKNFKNFVDPHMADIEQLNRMGGELLEGVPANQGRSIRDSIKNINARWKDLNKAISDRQSDLDKALLQLGQFQHALNELVAWIAKMEKSLADGEPIYADPQIIEVEISKHKVVMNDIHAHQANVDQLNMVGKQLIDSEFGSESARSNRRKLDDLNNRWGALIQKAQDRSEQLEDCLRDSQNLAQEIQDMLSWLTEIDAQISTSKPVGGLPETARDQLNRFMEVYNELDKMRHKVESLLQNGEEYVSKAREGAAQHLTHNLKVLRSKWENILARANDRKIKLEIALKEATEFHEALQDFVDWLTQAENYLKNLSPVSRVVDHVLQQIEEHKNFQKDVSLHREVMLDLDKKGTHLKYFSQKQDVTLIKNLLSSVQNRWDNVLTKTAERARALDHGFKEAKEFYDMWSDLIGWLEDAEKDLDAIVQLGNNPDLIKQTLARHKEFQRQLGAKQTQYDHTMRYGKGLKDKAPNQDHPILQEMLDELKNKWNAVCQKSVDKQRKLEEALLFSGQFKDAIQALIEWLEKAKQLLGYDQPVHGDLETVNSLCEAHKSFIKDYHSREANLKFVRKTAADLVKSAQPEDARHIQAQIETLNEKWNEIEHLIKQKESRLQEALKEAEKLNNQVHTLLEWLSEAEMKLRFTGPLPEDEANTRGLMQEHDRFKQEMKSQERCKASALELSQVILEKCHPNAAPVLKHFQVIIQSRWDEVESWANQREKRLNNRLKSLMDTSDLMEELFKWANETEKNLEGAEKLPLPDDAIVLEKLVDEHQRLIDDVNDKRIDIDRVVKEYSVKKPAEKSTSRSRIASGRSVKSDISGLGMDTSVTGELRNPKAKELNTKFHRICKLSMERLKRLKDNLEYNRQVEKAQNFDFDDWKRRFQFYMEHKSSKMTDFFKRLDGDRDDRISKTELIDGILNSKFSTNRAEMEKVADCLDVNSDGSITYDDYIRQLRPDKEGQPKTESEMIEDELQRQVQQCTCSETYRVYQVGDGKYRFGDSQKLRLVRILRSNVMVRVGGGWVSLKEFLEKNDPCRARGRTNVELREQFVLADGVSQSMSPFKSKSPFRSDGSISMTGPISKIREKTDRSIPMSQGGFRYGSSGNESSDHEDLLRRPRSRLTPSNSRPGSRVGGSQPPSRNASDMSTESLDAFKRNQRPGSGLRSKSGSQTGLSVPPRTSSFNLGPSSSSPKWKY